MNRKLRKVTNQIIQCARDEGASSAFIPDEYARNITVRCTWGKDYKLLTDLTLDESGEIYKIDTVTAHNPFLGIWVDSPLKQLDSSFLRSSLDSIERDCTYTEIYKDYCAYDRNGKGTFYQWKTNHYRMNYTKYYQMLFREMPKLLAIWTEQLLRERSI